MDPLATLVFIFHGKGLVAGGQELWQELPPVWDPRCSSVLLRDGPHGTDPCCDSPASTAARGQPT